MSVGEVGDYRLLSDESLEHLVVELPVVLQSPNLAKVNLCQQEQMRLCGAISRDLVFGREPLSETPQEDIDLAHEVAVDTFSSVPDFCREFCSAGIAGTCIVALANSLSREQVVEVYAGDYVTTTYAGEQTYTTPVLQITNSVLGRASLPQGNSIANMSAKRVQDYADHLASTELGREAGLPERMALAI